MTIVTDGMNKYHCVNTFEYKNATKTSHNVPMKDIELSAPSMHTQITDPHISTYSPVHLHVYIHICALHTCIYTNICIYLYIKTCIQSNACMRAYMASIYGCGGSSSKRDLIGDTRKTAK